MKVKEGEIQIDKDTVPPAQKKKIVVAPHKKSKQIRLNKQALSEIPQSLESFSEAQNKRHQKTFDEKRRREERFLEFKREEAEKDMHRCFQQICTMQELFCFNWKNRSKQFLHLIKAFIPVFSQGSSFHPLVTKIMSHRQIFGGVSRSIPHKIMIAMNRKNTT